MANKNAMSMVEREAYFFNGNIPYSQRKETFARKMVLLVLFKGKKFANEWAKVNRPYEMRAMMAK
jgi:hypothetical protein